MLIHGFDRYGGPEVEGFFEVPIPQPVEGQVLVRLRAASVNPADIKVRSGQRAATIRTSFPMAMGREAAGVVVEDPLGSWPNGTRVFGACAEGTGALGEFALLDAASVAEVPEGVSDAAAASIPVAIATAWDALQELGVGPGDTVLVLGAGGGVGVHAVQVARHLGARVLGLVSAGKADLVAQFGGESMDRAGDWATAVRAAAHDGVDAVLDAVGGPTLDHAATLLRTPGRLRSIAAVPRAEELGGRGVVRRRTTAVFAEVVELLRSGAVVPVIDRIVPFEDAGLATAHVAEGHGRGKTVVAGPGLSAAEVQGP